MITDEKIFDVIGDTGYDVLEGGYKANAYGLSKQDVLDFARAIYKLGRESMLQHGNCSTCSNKGTIYGLSQESTCEHCVHQEQWRKNLYKEKSCA